MKSIIKSNNVKTVDQDTRLYLDSLGLSAHEITVYSILVSKNQPLSAQDLATDLFVFPSALYRIFKKLESLGLIHMVGKKPLRYQAIDKNTGLKTAYKLNQENIMQFLNNATNNTNLSETKVIIGRQATYDTYIEIAKLAGKSIDLYAIGIAYSKNLHHAQEEAMNKGVKIRHVVQQYQPNNFHVINKWKNLGVDIRYLKTPRGFHFTQIDKAITLITFSDPSDTENRLSILTDNPSVCKLFADSF